MQECSAPAQPHLHMQGALRRGGKTFILGVRELGDARCASMLFVDTLKMSDVDSISPVLMLDMST